MAIKTFKSGNKKDLKWPKIIIAILSTIGLVDTGSITLKNWGLFNSLSCPGIKNGCETVLNSPWVHYSRIFNSIFLSHYSELLLTVQYLDFQYFYH